MYEILVNATMPLELEQFFAATKNFGKKFYTYGGSFYSEREATVYDGEIKITAIAISRDMTYILHFEPYAKCWINSDEFKRYAGKTHLNGTHPPYNLVPDDVNLRSHLFPYEEDTGDYRDTFYWNDFVLVGNIRKDGVEL